MIRFRMLAVATLLLAALALAVHGIPARASIDSPPPQAGLQPAAVPYATVPQVFTYQGYLTDGGVPAEGAYDFAFSLFGDEAGSEILTVGVPVPDVLVTGGYFTALVDLGDAPIGDQDLFLNGEPRWLLVSVRPGDSDGVYTPLWPAQPLTPVPYAHALPGLYTVQNEMSPGVVGGYARNSVAAGTYGATVSGGGNEALPNEVSGHFGTVSGGQGNRAFGQYSTVAGGKANTAGGEYSTVAGGIGNSASADYAFAAGRRAKAVHTGAFVWADSSDADLFSEMANQFLVRASSGASFEADNTGYGLHVDNSSSWGNGDGIQVYANSATLTEGAAVRAVNIGGGPGVFASSIVGYSGHFAGDIYVGGSCVGCTLLYVALNDGDVPLEEGDLVTASGLARSLAGSESPVLRVRRAGTVGEEAVVGVVRGRGRLEVAPPREGEPGGGSAVESVILAEGPAGPGDYLFLVVQGVARVRADASAGAIAVGQRLVAAAGPAGGARVQRTVVVDGLTVVEGTPALGVALEPLDAGTGLIAVLVDLQ